MFLTFPAVAIILMFIASAATSNIPIFWLIAWWITGCLCSVVLFYAKGETFGGGIQYAVSVTIIGCLGFTLIPFAIPATFLATYLAPKKWMKETEKRDQRITQWALVGYPKNQEFKDLWFS